MEVVVYGNVDEVELFHNEQSLGKKAMPTNGRCSWHVRYAPGQLHAQGYHGGRATHAHTVFTTAAAAAIAMRAHVRTLRARSPDVAVIDISVLDKHGRVVPTADSLLHFAIDGPGRILGVGNGNPSSLEADVQVETLRSQALGFIEPPDPSDPRAAIAFETRFDLPVLGDRETIDSLLLNAVGERQTVVLNGRDVYRGLPAEQAHTEVRFDELTLRDRGNTLRVDAHPFLHQEQFINWSKTAPARLLIRRSPEPYTRRAFNGWAQVIVQAGDTGGTLTLSASAAGLRHASVTLPVD
jgi:beta-galactosidase